MITLELHAEQNESVLRPMVSLKIEPVLVDYIRSTYENELMDRFGFKDFTGLCLVSPDSGRVPANQRLAEKIHKDVSVAHINQIRDRDNPDEKPTYGVLGDYKGKVAYITDDIFASGATSVTGASALEEAVYRAAILTHGWGYDSKEQESEEITSFDEKLAKSNIDEFVVTDTRPCFVEKLRKSSKIESPVRVLSVVPMFGEVIKRHYDGQTIREMIEDIGKNIRGRLYNSIELSK